ncbi:hypothetical protein FoTM2_016830 [Fusarium oxysporum f. sp. vasinfectum]|nr:hypothetical protein FoTM2_016830 [Fusarium oxysporum f. sp. vasinfectum]
MDSPSPKLKPICPKLNLSRSPSPDIPRDQIGTNGTPQATGGVDMLLRHLGNGWNPPEIALEVARESLLCDEDSLSEEPRREGAVDGNLASGTLPINGPFVPRYISGNTVTSPLIPLSNESLSPLYHGVRAPAGEPPSQSLPAHPNKILVMLAQAHPRPSQIRELEVWDIRLPISYRHPIHHQMDIEHLHHALRQVRVRTIAQ